MKSVSNRIVCCYLYPITRYGYPPPGAGTPLYLREMHQLGYQSVELEGIREKHLLEVDAVLPEVLAVQHELNLEIPYFCAVLPDLSSPDAEVRQQQLVLLRKACKIAQKLGSKGIVDNGPLPPYVFPDSIPVARHYHSDVLRSATMPENLVWKDYYHDLAQTYREVCRIAADHGLTYQIHPCEGVLTSTTDGYLRFAEAVSANNLRFNFDTANLFALGENLTVSWLQVKEHVDYIHISDNGGSRIEHLALGEGVIQWDDFFHLLKKTGYAGSFGVDIGGAESSVHDLDTAYQEAAGLIESKIQTNL